MSMLAISLVYGLVVVITVIFGIALSVLANRVEDLYTANNYVDHDLEDVEASISEHSQLLADLDVMRRQMESLPDRILALETRNRVVSGGEEDVVYATGQGLDY